MKKRFLLVIMAICVAIGLKAQETSLRDTVAFPNTNQSTALIQTGGYRFSCFLISCRDFMPPLAAYYPGPVSGNFHR